VAATTKTVTPPQPVKDAVGDNDAHHRPRRRRPRDTWPSLTLLRRSFVRSPRATIVSARFPFKAPNHHRRWFPLPYDYVLWLDAIDSGKWDWNGFLIQCGIGLQGWGCDFVFFLCVLFAGWNGVVMLRWWFYKWVRRDGDDNGKDWCLCWVRRESGDNWRNWSVVVEWRMSFFGVLMMVEENRAWVAIFCFIGCEKRRMNLG